MCLIDFLLFGVILTTVRKVPISVIYLSTKSSYRVSTFSWLALCYSSLSIMSQHQALFSSELMNSFGKRPFLNLIGGVLYLFWGCSFPRIWSFIATTLVFVLDGGGGNFL